MLSAVPLAASAEDYSLPRECIALAARVQQETSATYVRMSSYMVLLDPHLPGSRQMSVGCPYWSSGPEEFYFTLDWNGALPPREFYQLAARGGFIVLGEAERLLTKAAGRCIEAAHRSETELASVWTPKTRIECQAFARDGGGAFISIWARRKGEQPGEDDELVAK